MLKLTELRSLSELALQSLDDESANSGGNQDIFTCPATIGI